MCLLAVATNMVPRGDRYTILLKSDFAFAPPFLICRVIWEKGEGHVTFLILIRLIDTRPLVFSVLVYNLFEKGHSVTVHDKSDEHFAATTECKKMHCVQNTFLSRK